MKYAVTFPPEGMPTCVCQRPQLTGIPCNHVLAVCFVRRINPNVYVNPYYSLQNYINTWSGHFAGFGNKRDWPLYNGPIIRPDPDKVNKGRRKHQRRIMTMDKMEAPARRLNARQHNQESTTARHSGIKIQKIIRLHNYHFI